MSNMAAELEDPTGVGSGGGQDTDSAEAVEAYLHREFIDAPERVGSKVPPVRTIARGMGVSPALVHNVFRKLQVEGKLVSTVGRGTFVVPQKTRSGSKEKGRYCFAMSAQLHGLSNSLSWGGRLIEAFFRAAGCCGKKVAILPLEHEGEDRSMMAEELIAEIGEVDGLILFPNILGGLEPKVRSAYHAHQTPFVCINPPSVTATEGFVSGDYYRAGFRLGSAFAETNRKRIVYFSSEVLKTNPSELQRVHGLRDGMFAVSDSEVDFEIVCSSDISIESGYTIMKGIFRRATRPDVVVTFGDLLALGALRAAKDLDLHVPGEVSIVGGSGLIKPMGEDLATLMYPFEEVAEHALKMLLDSARNGGNSFPGRYIPIGIYPGSTLRAEEALLLNGL